MIKPGAALWKPLIHIREVSSPRSKQTEGLDLDQHCLNAKSSPQREAIAFGQESGRNQMDFLLFFSFISNMANAFITSEEKSVLDFHSKTCLGRRIRGGKFKQPSNLLEFVIRVNNLCLRSRIHTFIVPFIFLCNNN